MEMYVQGLSTSLPYDVQADMLHSIPGLERCEIMRPGYAIEYDCIDPNTLNTDLGSKASPGLYFAGELIDVDATTGGFNLQIAFSTGALAGASAATGE